MFTIQQYKKLSKLTIKYQSGLSPQTINTLWSNSRRTVVAVISRHLQRWVVATFTSMAASTFTIQMEPLTWTISRTIWGKWSMTTGAGFLHSTHWSRMPLASLSDCCGLFPFLATPVSSIFSWPPNHSKHRSVYHNTLFWWQKSWRKGWTAAVDLLSLFDDHSLLRKTVSRPHARSSLSHQDRPGVRWKCYPTVPSVISVWILA